MIPLNLPQYFFRIKNEGEKYFIYDNLRRKFVVLTPEEWVRQNFVKYLVQEKKFPAGRIGNEIFLIQNGRKRRCDTVVYDSHGSPLVIVEYKAPHIHITQATFDQICRYNSVLQVRYLMVSNGLVHYCCEVNCEEKRSIFLREIPFYSELMEE